MNKVTDEKIIEECKNCKSMREVSFKLNISQSTLKRRAKKLGCYNPQTPLSKNNYINDERFIEICNNFNSMREAASWLEMPFTTFKRKAEKLGCYTPNQGLKGIEKPPENYNSMRFNTEDILNGKYPHYDTGKLKQRLIKEGYKENKCEVCGIKEWNKQEIKMELDHIDGDSSNHLWENIRLVCPNCHSQLPNYCGSNKHYKGKRVTDEEFIEALKESITIGEAIDLLELSHGMSNYRRGYKLIKENF